MRRLSHAFGFVSAVAWFSPTGTPTTERSIAVANDTSSVGSGNRPPIMSALGLLSGFFLLIVTAAPAAGQAPTDTVLAKWGAISDEPSISGSEIVELEWGDTLRVEQKKKVSADEKYLRVVKDEVEGWLLEELVMSPEQRRKYAKALATPGTLRVTRKGAIRNAPFSFGDRVATLVNGDTVRVQFREGSYARVKHDGKRGWLSLDLLMSEEEAREYRQKLRSQRREARQRRQYLRTLRERGYTIVLARQTFRKNSADGISVGLGLANISRAKTVKYLRITWKLFNSVGEPTKGENSGRSTARTKLVGPIESGETGYTEFENVWYNSVGTCAEIRGIVVEHIDGSSFTYINDLNDIAREAESVRLMGDCSYEAQQKRKN